MPSIQLSIAIRITLVFGFRFMVSFGIQNSLRLCALSEVSSSMIVSAAIMTTVCSGNL